MSKGEHVGGYHILPVLLSPQNTQRNIYFKQHKGKNSDRTLFVTNFPVACPLVEIIRLFSQFGEIENLHHGSLNKKALGKTRAPRSVLKLQQLDPNLNINVGRSFKTDYDLKYKKINDIQALEARRAEARRAIREKVTGISANATKKGKQTNDQSKEVDQTNKNNEEEEEEEYNLPDNPSFLGCEYMHITFAEEEDLENLLKLKRSDLSENFDLTLDYSCEVDEEEDAMEDETVSELPSAASRWIQAYQETLADPKELEKESNAFMRQFDSKIRQEAEERARKAKEEEDGWTVVGGSKKVKTADGSAQVTGIKAEDVILRRSKKSKILDNFYKFQKQEQRHEKLAELRKQFEADKERIEQMKSARQFRPFK